MVKLQKKVFDENGTMIYAGHRSLAVEMNRLLKLTDEQIEREMALYCGKSAYDLHVERHSTKGVVLGFMVGADKAGELLIIPA